MTSKPHLRCIRGFWYCFRRPMEPVRIGWGLTPNSAYTDWNVTADGPLRGSIRYIPTYPVMQ